MILLHTEEIQFSRQTETSLQSKHLFAFKMLENIDSDYITFILGFISSVVINDYYSIFGLQVKGNPLIFWLMFAECVFLTAANVMLLSFAVNFSKMQKELLPHRTVEARQNYFKDKMLGRRTKKLLIKMLLISICIVLSVLLNVFKFVWINFICV